MKTKLVKPSEIKDLLPEDSLVIPRDSPDYKIEEEAVLFIEGDFHAADIDFDNLEAYLPANEKSDFIFMIYVAGNVTARNIYNHDVDGAAGLVVTGDLTADNIVVGGQEIYVGGNLSVNELFWGDYNHGTLKVAGAISAKVFISTDYSYPHERFINNDRVSVKMLFTDDAGYFDRNSLETVFQPECLFNAGADYEIYGWGDWLLRSAMLYRIAQGQNLLLDNPGKYELPQVDQG